MDLTGKIELDFEVVDTYNPKKLVVLDTSSWGRLEKKPAIIEILMPGSKDPIKHYLFKNGANIFNSFNLEVNCVSTDEEYIDLPDGVYHITIKGSPDSYNFDRKFLRTAVTQMELDKLYIKLLQGCNCKKLKDELTDINMLLRGAEANLRYDNLCKAQELFMEAQKLIDKLKNCE